MRIIFAVTGAPCWHSFEIFALSCAARRRRMLSLLTMNLAELVATGQRATATHATPVRLVEAGGTEGHEMHVSSAHSTTVPAAGSAARRSPDAPPGYSAARPARNVLYLVFDDLRPDLSFYGAAWMRTPHLQRLARSGTTFDAAYCQQTVCAPSRMSFSTGRRPNSTRAWNFLNHIRQVPNNTCRIRVRVRVR